MAGAGVVNLDLSGFSFDFINKGKEAKAYASGNVEAEKIRTAGMVQAAAERNKVMLTVGIGLVIVIALVIIFKN
jgi:hypothetical protein